MAQSHQIIKDPVSHDAISCENVHYRILKKKDKKKKKKKYKKKKKTVQSKTPIMLRSFKIVSIDGCIS